MVFTRPAAGVVVLCAPLSFATTPPTFSRDVAPIIYAKCASCHHDGGEAPFSLTTYAEAAKRAPLLAAVTRSRFMPPWQPEQGYGDFAGNRRLSDEEIRTLSDWAAAGAPEGNQSQKLSAPEYPDGWQLGTPDLVIEASQAFTAPATGPDVYWNFVFRPAVPARHWVRAVEIRPGQRNLIHHANLLLDRMPVPHGAGAPEGFPGMDLDIRRSPFDPDGDFLFWKPGSPPRIEPSGFAWRIDPGTELILNTHIHPTGKAAAVRPSIGIYFTDQPQTKFPLVFQLQNDNALHIPAGAHDFTVGDDFKLPLDADVLGIYPHMHYVGRLVEAWATLPGGTRQWLIRIPSWDPAWQAVYYYREPVFLPQGTVISVRWHYDNSASNPRNPNAPPRPVSGGNQATDEMAHLWLQVLPRGERDRRRELDQAVLGHRLEKNPADFEANLNLGAVELSRLDPQGAITPLERALRADPGRTDARNMLGLAFAATGRVNDAIRQYDIVLAANPGDGRTHFNRANALMKAGRIDEAIQDYRAAMAAFPDDPLPKQRLDDALKAAAGSSQ
jgi:cytochrome c553